MAVNYSKPIPKDRNDTPLQEYPPAASSLGTVVRENANVSSVTALTANTTTIEVAAVSTGAVIRWAVNQASSVISDAGTANFDNVIPAGTYRKFVVPRTTQALQNYNNQGTPSIVGLNVGEGLFGAVATKSLGVGSVLLTQY